MPTIDLHGMTLRDALVKVLVLYNQEVKSGFKTRIRVIHGYGSSGVGGVIRVILREQLASHGVRFETGEYAENNPGVTTVVVGTECLPKGFLTPRRGGDRQGAAFDGEFFRQLKEEKQILQDRLRESENQRRELERSVGRLGGEKEGLARQLKERDEQLGQLTRRLQALDGRHKELEGELGSHKQREDELLTWQRNLTKNVNLREARLREQAAEELRKIQARRAELEAEQDRLNRERGGLSAEKRLVEAARAKLDGKRKTQVSQANVIVKQVEKLRQENEALRGRLREAESWGAGNPQPRRRHLVLALCALMVISLTGCFFLTSCLYLFAWHLRSRKAPAPSEAPQAIAAVPPAAPPPASSPRADTGKGSPVPAAEPPPVAQPKPVVQASDASNWVGKECTVEMTVRSTKDLGWAVVLNSEPDFRSPKNFAALIEKSTAGAKYEGKGVRDVGLYFRNKKIKVTGSVRAYRGKAEMTVKQPEQVEIAP
jgi:hypothetical protein